MMDPRKPVVRPSVEGQKEILAQVHDHLMQATLSGAGALGMTGVSFVMIGIGVFAAELSEVDGRASTNFLHALAVIFDPDATPGQKAEAEIERSKALYEIYSAVDLVMTHPAGRA